MPGEITLLDLHWDTISVPEWDHLIEGKYIVGKHIVKGQYILRPIISLGDLAIYLSEDSGKGSCTCAVWSKDGKKRGIPCEHLIYVKKYILCMDRLYVGRPYAIKMPPAAPPQEQSGEKIVEEPLKPVPISAPQAHTEQPLAKTEHPTLNIPTQEQAGKRAVIKIVDEVEPKTYGLTVSKQVGDIRVEITVNTKDVHETLEDVRKILSSL